MTPDHTPMESSLAWKSGRATPSTRFALDIIPTVIKAGGDGMQSADLLKGAGFPAVEGWYATVASPHFDESKGTAKAFGEAYFKKFNLHPDDYTVTCYVAAETIIQAVKDLVGGELSTTG